MTCRVLCFLFWSALAAAAPSHQAILDSYELVWTTLRDHYWDRTMGGLNWQQLHDRYLPIVSAKPSVAAAREPINQLIHSLPSSHLALIPAEAYGQTPNGTAPAHERKHLGGDGSTGITATAIGRQIAVEFSENSLVHPGWIIESIDGDNPSALLDVASPEILSEIVDSWLRGPVGSSANILFNKGGPRASMDIPRTMPSGKLVQFTNLPPERVIAKHRKLPDGSGYIRLNIFLDPVSVMPEFERAITDLQTAPGIILDLRGNPGGLGVMAMGIAGWFVAEENQRLGTMVGRNSKTEFEINPRVEPYTGKLAILVNGSSASTTEILAQGLKDLGRARIFGSRTAGAALPSNIIQLPDGDRFQYPEANYTSIKGRILEGNGVEPDVEAVPTIAALLAGQDLALESAMAWIATK